MTTSVSPPKSQASTTKCALPLKALNFARLKCDAILAKMQEMLLGFQADLGVVSEEIRGLQTEPQGRHLIQVDSEAAEWRVGFVSMPNGMVFGVIVPFRIETNAPPRCLRIDIV